MITRSMRFEQLLYGLYSRESISFEMFPVVSEYKYYSDADSVATKLVCRYFPFDADP